MQPQCREAAGALVHTEVIVAVLAEKVVRGKVETAGGAEPQPARGAVLPAGGAADKLQPAAVGQVMCMVDVWW